MAKAANWKDRFTQEQLERKRAADRIGHKKSRQRSKQTVTELEQRLRLVVNGERGTLINRLLDENVNLQRKLKIYESRLESIVQIGQECLGKESDHLNTQQAGTCSDSDAAGDEPGFGDASVSAKALAFEFLPSAASLLHEIFSFSPLNMIQDLPEAPESPALPSKQVINAVMTWKLFSGRGNAGLDLVVEHFCLTSNPPCMTLEHLERAVLSESTYEDVLERLLYDGPEFDQSSERRIPELSEMERHRRAAAICACENTRRWRDHFRSDREYIALFWAQYRYFLFLIFPTAENYSKCFPWYRPHPMQFSLSHPAFIDFLVWPQLRAYLAKNWQRYSAQDLIISLIRNFEVDDRTTASEAWIKLKPDLSGLEINEAFERVVGDIENLTTNENFCKEFPDLSLYVKTESRCPGDRHTVETSAAPLRHEKASSTSGNRGFLASPPDTLWAVPSVDQGVERSFGQTTEQVAVEHNIPEARPASNWCSAPPSDAVPTVSPGLGQCLFSVDGGFGNRDLAAIASFSEVDFAHF